MPSFPVMADKQAKHPGRKKILIQCPFCYREFGVAELRAHLPRCPKRKKTEQ